MRTTVSKTLVDYALFPFLRQRRLGRKSQQLQSNPRKHLILTQGSLTLAPLSRRMQCKHMYLVHHDIYGDMYVVTKRISAIFVKYQGRDHSSHFVAVLDSVAYRLTISAFFFLLVCLQFSNTLCAVVCVRAHSYEPLPFFPLFPGLCFLGLRSLFGALSVSLPRFIFLLVWISPPPSLTTACLISPCRRQVFQTFACEKLPEIGTAYLRADFRIECYTPKHNVFRIYAGFMIILCKSNLHPPPLPRPALSGKNPARSIPAL